MFKINSKKKEERCHLRSLLLNLDILDTYFYWFCYLILTGKCLLDSFSQSFISLPLVLRSTKNLMEIWLEMQVLLVDCSQLFLPVFKIYQRFG